MAVRGSPDLAIPIERNAGGVTLSIDQNIYSQKAVMRASHWHTGELWISISRSDADHLAVSIKPKNDSVDIDRAIAEFQNSLLDAQLRVEIADETATVRDLIVAKAFAEGDILEDAPVNDWKDPVASPKSADSH
jgi:His-Xaa-Ser system protein HxsD